MAITLNGDISICYSGGLDSTAVAFMMAKQTRAKIHLLTFVHDHGLLFPEWSKKHVKDLKRCFGQERISHSYLNITSVINELASGSLLDNFRKYGNFTWCLGCSLSMAVRTVIYNLQNCVPNAMFCSSLGGDYAVMSMPVTREKKKDFYGEYAVEFFTPLMELGISKDEERRMLRSFGVWLGYRFRRGHHGVQPVCLPGFQHIGDVLFDMHTINDPLKVRQFIIDREPVMRSVVAAYFKEKGERVEDLVERLKIKKRTADVFNISKEAF